jgi:hypothetical protein
VRALPVVVGAAGSAGAVHGRGQGPGFLGVGVKFSTNGIKLDSRRAAQLARTDYVDVQSSLDGATADVNDHVRGPGSYDTAMGPWRT